MPKLDLNTLNGMMTTNEARRAPGPSLGPVTIDGTAEHVSEDAIDWNEIVNPLPPEDDQFAPPKKNPIPHAFRQFGDFSRFSTQGQVIEVLAKHIPQNEYNFPIFIYRPDLLPFARISELMGEIDSDQQRVGRALDDLLRASIMELYSNEGYPADYNGQPVWEKFEFEGREEYTMFLAYLNLGGQRAIHKVISWPPEVVNETSKVYYWPLRAHAFDVYRIAYHERRKLSRILDIEDKHYTVAEGALDKISTFLSNIMPEDLKELGLKGAIEAFEKLVKIQRLSVGLDGKGGTTSTDVLATPSMKQIMQKASGAQTIQQKAAQPIDVLTDLEDIDKAQELILRIQDSRNMSGTEGDR